MAKTVGQKMMDLADVDRQKKSIVRKTKNKMKKVGTYKEEFDETIERYADMRVRYNIVQKDWYGGGCKIVETYTNKTGATGERKATLYTCMEDLGSRLMEIETIFGLTPKGLKAIKPTGLNAPRESKLDKALMKL